jgi:methylated-DNA-[protein]-cysteine S-methyltransferase
MSETGSAEFDTAIGRCSISWRGGTIVAVRLPGTKSRSTSEPPAEVQRVIDAIGALLQGERVDLSWVPVDMSGVPEFNRRVYEVARTIPVGSTATYGDIAGLLRSPTASRAVGKALARNPFAIVVPCHRVVGADGEVGGFSAGGGVNTKMRMLAIEGARAEQTSLFEEGNDRDSRHGGD